MAFYATVISGIDEGKVVRIDDRPCTVGRSPNAALSLEDPSVGFEHVVLTGEGGRLYVENLSTLGTRVRGRAIESRTALSPGEQVTLSESCKLEVGKTGDAGAKASGSRTAVLAVVVLLLLVIGGGAVVVMKQRSRPTGPPGIREIHWQTGYTRISQRMEQWVAAGRFDPYMVAMFHDAWRLEQSGDMVAARQAWLDLQKALMTAHLDGAMDPKDTFASHGGNATTALGVVMGWDPQRPMDDFQFNTDGAFAEATWAFIVQRVLILKKRIDAK